MNLTKQLADRENYRPGYSYKLAVNQYALDSVSEKFYVDESRMAAFIPFASGEHRDGVGDLLEVSGIETDRHKLNPIVLFDHGKQITLPIGMAEDPQDKSYQVQIDPRSRTGGALCFFYGSKGIPQEYELDTPDGERSFKQPTYEHALFCEQVFDMMAKRFIRGGSIGYTIIEARELAPDLRTGTPAGLHLIRTKMLELSAVILPANADTVSKSFTDWDKARAETVREILSMPKICGKAPCSYLVKSLNGMVGSKANSRFPRQTTRRQREGRETAGNNSQEGQEYWNSRGHDPVWGPGEYEDNEDNTTTGAEESYGGDEATTHTTNQEVMRSQSEQNKVQREQKAVATPSSEDRRRTDAERLTNFRDNPISSSPGANAPDYDQLPHPDSDGIPTYFENQDDTETDESAEQEYRAAPSNEYKEPKSGQKAVRKPTENQYRRSTDGERLATRQRREGNDYPHPHPDLDEANSVEFSIHDDTEPDTSAEAEYRAGSSGKKLPTPLSKPIPRNQNVGNNNSQGKQTYEDIKRTGNPNRADQAWDDRESEEDTTTGQDEYLGGEGKQLPQFPLNSSQVVRGEQKASYADTQFQNSNVKYPATESENYDETGAKQREHKEQRELLGREETEWQQEYGSNPTNTKANYAGRASEGPGKVPFYPVANEQGDSADANRFHREQDPESELHRNTHQQEAREFEAGKSIKDIRAKYRKGIKAAPKPSSIERGEVPESPYENPRDSWSGGRGETTVEYGNIPHQIAVTTERRHKLEENRAKQDQQRAGQTGQASLKAGHSLERGETPKSNYDQNERLSFSQNGPGAYLDYDNVNAEGDEANDNWNKRREDESKPRTGQTGQASFKAAGEGETRIEVVDKRPLRDARGHHYDKVDRELRAANQNPRTEYSTSEAQVNIRHPNGERNSAEYTTSNVAKRVAGNLADARDIAGDPVEITERTQDKSVDPLGPGRVYKNPLSNSKVPPARFKPGVGAIKALRAKYRKALRRPRVGERVQNTRTGQMGEVIPVQNSDRERSEVEGNDGAVRTVNHRQLRSETGEAYGNVQDDDDTYDTDTSAPQYEHDPDEKGLRRPNVGERVQHIGTGRGGTVNDTRDDDWGGEGATDWTPDDGRQHTDTPNGNLRSETGEAYGSGETTDIYNEDDHDDDVQSQYDNESSNDDEKAIGNPQPTDRVTLTAQGYYGPATVRGRVQEHTPETGYGPSTEVQTDNGQYIDVNTEDLRDESGAQYETDKNKLTKSKTPKDTSSPAGGHVDSDEANDLNAVRGRPKVGDRVRARFPRQSSPANEGTVEQIGTPDEEPYPYRVAKDPEGRPSRYGLSELTDSEGTPYKSGNSINEHGEIVTSQSRGSTTNTPKDTSAKERLITTASPRGKLTTRQQGKPQTKANYAGVLPQTGGTKIAQHESKIPYKYTDEPYLPTHLRDVGIPTGIDHERLENSERFNQEREEFNQGKSQRKVMPPKSNKDEKKRPGSAAMGDPKIKSNKAMDTNQLQQATDEASQEPYDMESEPYGAQIMRKLHADHLQLMQDYDSLIAPLEDEGVIKLLTGKLANTEKDLSDYEKFWTKHKRYKDLPPLINGEDQLDEMGSEEELDLAVDELASPDDPYHDQIPPGESEEELHESEPGRKPGKDAPGKVSPEQGDMDTLDDEANPANSGAELEETPPEEAWEASQMRRGTKSLVPRDARHKYLMINRINKGLCPGCGSAKCMCGKSMIAHSKANYGSQHKITGDRVAVYEDGDTNSGRTTVDPESTLAADEEASEKSNKTLGAWDDREQSCVGEACGFLNQIAQEGSLFDEEARMKSYHFHKTLDGMANIKDMIRADGTTLTVTPSQVATVYQGKPKPANRNVDKAKFRESLSNFRKQGKSGDDPYQSEDIQSSQASQQGAATASFPGDPNWAKEEGQEPEHQQETQEPHPHRLASREASEFFRRLAGERAFGDPHRQEALNYHQRLSGMLGDGTLPETSGLGGSPRGMNSPPAKNPSDRLEVFPDDVKSLELIDSQEQKLADLMKTLDTLNGVLIKR